MTMDDLLLIAIGHDHMYDSVFKNQRYCFICRQLLPLDGNMLTHIRTHQGEDKNKIKVEKLFKRYPAIRRAAFMCNYCSKTFPTEERLAFHDRLHGNGGKPYECFYCDRRFAASKYLKGHEVTHVPGPNSSECPDCGVSFSLSSVYLEHRAKGTCSIENFGCCDTVFTRRIDFLKHQQDFHKGKKIKCHACNICGKNFSLPCALKAHEKFHVNPAPRKKRTPRSGPKDGEEKPKLQSFSCRVCKQVFTNRGELCKHSQSEHVDDKPFVCNICNKGYTQKGNYILHLRSHDGKKEVKKPWHCNYCQKAFVSGQALQAHERVHTGEKPFECGYCERKFSRAWSLTTHIATHTGEKRYPCPECGRRFTQKSTQVSHTKTHFKDPNEVKPKRKKKKSGNPGTSRNRDSDDDDDDDEEDSVDHFDLLYVAMGLKK